MNKKQWIGKISVLILFVWLLVGCGGGETETADSPTIAATTEPVSPTDTPQPEPTETAVPPTATLEPTDAPVEEVGEETAVEEEIQEEAPPPPYEIISNVPYIDDGEEKHLLDIYLPNEVREPVTTLFMVHPGGFSQGMKEWMFPFANHFASAGYAVVSINYRLVPDFIYPSQQQDTFCALAWLHNQAAEYGLDAERIVAFGYSAGSVLVNLVGTIDDPTPYLVDCPHSLPESDWVRGTISLAGRGDLTLYPELEENIAVLGGSYAEVPELWQEASAVNYVDGSERPFLVARGTVDELILESDFVAFATALDEAGVSVTVDPIPDAGHFFAVEFDSEQTLHFLAVAEAFLAELP